MTQTLLRGAKDVLNRYTLNTDSFVRFWFVCCCFFVYRSGQQFLVVFITV